MSASAFALRSSGDDSDNGRGEATVAVRVVDPVVVSTAKVALSHRQSPVGATALLILAALLLGFAGYVGGLGTVVHARTQRLAYADLRQQLANASAPVGQLNSNGSALDLGAPVALLDGPGVREVVREGTAAGVLTGGPGHRRDSVLPGQAGTSVLYGRRAAFAGPFHVLTTWAVGTRFTVTTGQGKQAFRVTAVRRAGDPGPVPLPADAARVSLVTADGSPFQPSGLLIVDASLVGPVQASAPVRPVFLSAAERPLAGDRSALVGLVLWGQALVIVACLVVLMANRWGGRQAWVVGVPLVAVLGVAVAQSAAQLLPNLV